ncbi:MAG: YihY/virulence factor BrkB family protein [Candidatus Nanopelagicales bacterium]
MADQDRQALLDQADREDRDEQEDPDQQPQESPGRLQSLLARFDDYQQRHAWIAVPLAVYKKFGEDEAGKLAALISYYAFLSIFPLLIVLATVLTRVLAGNQELADQIIDTAAGSFLSIGSTGQVQPMQVAGWALVVGLLVTLWSGLAVANTMQDAMNTVYAVPKTERAGLPWRLLRSVTLLIIVGIGLPAATILSGLVAAWFGPLATAAGLLAVVAINTGLIALAFRRATVAETTWRSVLPGAFIAAVAWSLMQSLATSLLTSRVEGAQQTYGSFALVVGLLFWFFTLAQITLYCAELNMVLDHKLWPRSMKAIVESEAETQADVRAVSSYPKREKQAKNVDVQVDVSTDAGKVESGS